MPQTKNKRWLVNMLIKKGQHLGVEERVRVREPEVTIARGRNLNQSTN